MINPKNITNNVVRRLESIGINPEVNGKPSHTANLVELIVNAIIEEIQLNAEVKTVVSTSGISSYPGTIEQHTGTGIGNKGSIS